MNMDRYVSSSELDVVVVVVMERGMAPKSDGSSCARRRLRTEEIISSLSVSRLNLGRMPCRFGEDELSGDAGADDDDEDEDDAASLVALLLSFC